MNNIERSKHFVKEPESINPDTEPNSEKGQEIHELLGEIKVYVDKVNVLLKNPEPLRQHEERMIADLLESKEKLENDESGFFKQNPSYEEKFYKVFNKLERKLLGKIKDHQPSRLRDMHVLLLSYLSFSKDGTVATESKSILEQGFEGYLLGSEKISVNPHTIYRASHVIAEDASPKKFEKLESWLNRAYEENPKMRYFEFVLMPGFVTDTDRNIKKLALKTFSKLCKKANLPEGKTLEAWTANSLLTGKRLSKPMSREDQGNLFKVFEKNMLSIYSLESKQPGACRALYEKFGVLNFGRYKDEIWLKQLESQYKDMPNVLVINSQSDWNAASFGDASREVYSKLSKSLGQQYALRVVEAADKLELAKLLNHWKKNYKIFPTAVIFNGHGMKDFVLGEFRYGKKHYKNYINYKAIQDPRVEDYLKLAGPKTTFIFDSCGTYKPKTFATYLASKVDGQVIFPNGQSSVEDFGPMIFKNGRIMFKVRYADNVPMVKIEEKGNFITEDVV